MITSDAIAQEAAPLSERFLLGVATHQGLGGATGDRGYVPSINIQQIKDLDLNAYRDDFSWSDFEIPGKQSIFPESLQRLEWQLAAGVGRPLLILGQGHPLVPNSYPPTTDEARRRFVAYAMAAAQAVSTKHPLFELWNEWNIAARQNSDFNADNYLVLAKATYVAVKQILPEAPFIIGAIGDDPGWRWTNSLFDKGLLKYADGISIHLYNHCAPVRKRTATEVIERLITLHQMVDRASNHPNFPVYLTETGWPTVSTKCGVSEQAAADNFAQLVLWASTATDWLKGVWFYELKDSGINPAELEDNFGIHHFDNSPKPSFCAIKDAWAFIRSSVSSKVAKAPENVTMIQGYSNTAQQVAVWSDDAAKSIEVRIKGDARSGQFRYPCDAVAKTAGEGWLKVSSRPLLLELDRSASLEIEFRSAD
jgi:hypothetical protein